MDPISAKNLGMSEVQTQRAEKLDRDSHDASQAKQVAEEFESLFLGLVLKSMRNSVQKSGLIDGGNAEDIYKSMLDDEYTKIMAAQRGTGIAEQIEDFLALHNQGAGKKAYAAQALPPEPKPATMKSGEPAPHPISALRPVAL
jgi:flagellar protein FlgJ